MIRYAAVPDLRSVFALGCFERRVTVYSQQVRALNLVYSLVETRRLKRDGRLAVVGGGFAGLTVAAAAAQLGANVTLFEREKGLLSLQAGCSLRRIHPNIFDWPADSSERRNAGLPILTWTENAAKAAVAQVLRAWGKVPGVERIEQKLGHIVTQIVSGAVVTSRPESGGDPEIHPAFECVVVCAGFGVERDVVVPYWDRRSIERPSTTGRPRYLVSGLGDGAVADVLALRLGDPKAPLDLWVTKEALPRVPPSLRADILHLEREAQLIDPDKPAVCAAHYANGYGRYLADGVGDLLAAVANRCRKDTDVLWAGPLEHPYSRGATPLNRFLAAVLRRIDDRSLTFERGTTKMTPSGLTLTPGGGGPSRLMPGHTWVPRHGADVSALFRALFDPSVVQKLEQGITKFGFDAPRAPIWPAGYFRSPARPALTPVAPPAEHDPPFRALYAVMDVESATTAYMRGTPPASAAIRSELGYGMLATVQQADAQALAAALTNTLRNSIARATSDSGELPRPFQLVLVYVPVGETIPLEVLRRNAGSVATNIEALAEARRRAEPKLVAVNGEIDLGSRRIEVHSVLLPVLERVRLTPPRRQPAKPPS